MRPSSIDRMPKAIQDEIGRLRREGRHIDEILAHLKTIGAPQPSRAALGRHIKGFDQLASLRRKSVELTAGMMEGRGDAPDTQTARLNIELMQGTLLDIYLRAAAGETVSEGAADALAGDPQAAMLMARTMESLTRAARNNAELERQVKEAADAKARAVAEAAATIVSEAAKQATPPSPEMMIARIRALYTGEAA